jgi:hypothetical protein
VNGINRDEEHPERETEDPRVWGIPKIQYQLGSSEIGRDGDGVVEPIIPGKGKSVGWGKESGGVGIKRACMAIHLSKKWTSSGDNETYRVWGIESPSRLGEVE